MIIMIQLAHVDASTTIASSRNDGGGLKVVTEPLMETSECENHVKSLLLLTA